MNKEISFFMELDDERVEQLLKYSSYSEKSLDNIKRKVAHKKLSRRKGLRKRILMVAAALLISTGATIAATADFDKVYRAFFGKQAEYIQNQGNEMELVTEAAGIELSLISVFVHERNLTMIFLIRDKEGNRIDEFTEFFTTVTDAQDERIELQRYELMSDFDEETGELMRMEQFVLPPDIDIEEITCTLAFLRGGFVNRGGYEAQIDLYSEVLNHAPSTVPANQGYPKLLAPGETHIPFYDIDWSYISNIGFVDGYLHIQIKDDPLLMPYAPLMPARGFVYPWLVDSNGAEYGYIDNDEAEVVKEYTLRGLGEKGEEVYREYVFANVNDIVQLKNMRLAKTGYEATEIIDAEWSLKFMLPRESESLTIPVNKWIPVAPDKKWFADSIVMTPLGVEVSVMLSAEDVDDFYDSEYDYVKFLSDDLQFITYDDGSIFYFRFNQFPYMPQKGKETIRYTRTNPTAHGVIEIDRIKSITIQGMEFLIKK